MKYRGIMELSVREYLGVEDGLTAWRVVRNAVGIKIGDEVYDYKTLEKYNFISRQSNSKYIKADFEVKKGEIYAFESTYNEFDINQKYNHGYIEKIIESTDKYEPEYKNVKVKTKRMFK